MEPSEGWAWDRASFVEKGLRGRDLVLRQSRAKDAPTPKRPESFPDFARRRKRAIREQETQDEKKDPTSPTQSP